MHNDLWGLLRVKQEYQRVRGRLCKGGSRQHEIANILSAVLHDSPGRYVLCHVKPGADRKNIPRSQEKVQRGTCWGKGVLLPGLALRAGGQKNQETNDLLAAGDAQPCRA